MNKDTTNKYDEQAEKFLADNGITFRAVLKDTKSPMWYTEKGEIDHGHGHHYRVTLKKASKRLSFDFWGSVADKKAGKRTERAYSVLSCISGDVSTPDTFKDFCCEFGYDEDSRSDYATFKRCSKFAKRLREFFTADEIEALQEIQ